MGNQPVKTTEKLKISRRYNCMAMIANSWPYYGHSHRLVISLLVDRRLSYVVTLMLLNLCFHWRFFSLMEKKMNGCMDAHIAIHNSNGGFLVAK